MAFFGMRAYCESLYRPARGSNPQRGENQLSRKAMNRGARPDNRRSRKEGLRFRQKGVRIIYARDTSCITFRAITGLWAGKGESWIGGKDDEATAAFCRQSW